MEDSAIVDLYLARREDAIKETAQKYGKYCYAISYRILHSDADAEECVNDAYLGAWNAIPPHKPMNLQTFVGKIVRNISINRYEKRRAEKRFGAVEHILDEYMECIPDESCEPTDALALREALNAFLSSQAPTVRTVFLRRYYYFCSVKEIAEMTDITVSNVKIILHRMRRKLREHLLKEEIFV